LRAALGTQYVGAVLVPVNTRYRGHEAADVVARTGARVLVVGQGFLGTDHLGLLRAAAGEATGPDLGAGPVAGLPDLETVVVVGDAPPPPGPGGATRRRAAGPGDGGRRRRRSPAAGNRCVGTLPGRRRARRPGPRGEA